MTPEAPGPQPSPGRTAGAQGILAEASREQLRTGLPTTKTWVTPRSPWAGVPPDGLSSNQNQTDCLGTEVRSWFLGTELRPSPPGPQVLLLREGDQPGGGKQEAGHRWGHTPSSSRQPSKPSQLCGAENTAWAAPGGRLPRAERARDLPPHQDGPDQTAEALPQREAGDSTENGRERDDSASSFHGARAGPACPGRTEGVGAGFASILVTAILCFWRSSKAGRDCPLLDTLLPAPNLSSGGTPAPRGQIQHPCSPVTKTIQNGAGTG